MEICLFVFNGDISCHVTCSNKVRVTSLQRKREKEELSFFLKENTHLQISLSEYPWVSLFWKGLWPFIEFDFYKKKNNTVNGSIGFFLQGCSVDGFGSSEASVTRNIVMYSSLLRSYFRTSMLEDYICANLFINMLCP